MSVDKKILEELARYNKINNYIFEQETADLPPSPEDELGGEEGELPTGEVGTEMGVEPPAEPETGLPVDIETDPDVEKLNNDDEPENSETSTEEGGSEELDITDLVNSQKNIEGKQEEYFDNLFKHLDDLEGKLANMDTIVNKLNSLEDKIEKYRPRTPQEKLELRSIDSGPFKQKLTDFFDDKQDDLEKSGKNEYILTTDDVEQFSPDQIKDSFNM